jgi:heme/copper-type cytochrome/quinol oxidase subunit 1
MSEPAPEREARPRVNRWEIALWLIGVVLVVVPLVFMVLAAVSVNRVYSLTDGQPQPITVFQEVVETGAQLSPSILTAGLMSIILAIVVRALRASRTYPAIPAALSPVTEMIEIVQPSPIPPRVPAQTDHSLFMRPSEDRAKQGG